MLDRPISPVIMIWVRIIVIIIIIVVVILVVSGVFVTYFYNLSLALCIGTYVLFLSSSWPCGASMGPFAQLQNQVPINAISDYASGAGLSLLYT